MDTPDNATIVSPQIKQRRHRRWLLPTLLVVSLLVGLAVWMMHITARRTIVGKTDPTTGLRCVFTVAQGWPSVERPELSSRPNILDYFVFDLPKPTPFQTWLDTNIFHKPPAVRSLGRPGSLFITSVTGETFPGFELRDGYPTLKPLQYPAAIKWTQLEEKHLLLSGQPTLWATSRLDYPANFAPPGSVGKAPTPLYEYVFMVKVRDRPLWYGIGGIANEAHSRQIRNEVRGIGESLRIEKVSGK